MNQQLTEIASWRLITELCRRYPDRFDIIEMHPGGGMYDCLGLYNREQSVIAMLNRNGSFSVHNPFKEINSGESGWSGEDLWRTVAETHDLKRVVDRLSALIGLREPDSIPSTTTKVLVYRFIAAFLTHSSFGRAYWECRNGFLDSSGYGGGVKNDFFDPFPSAKEAVRIKDPDDVDGVAAYRFWFLLRNKEPVLCLETTGIVHRLDGKRYELMPVYKKHKRIWSVLVRVAGDLLP